MNKAQFADAIAQEAGMTKVEAQKALNASIRIAADLFRRGDSLTLSGLGTFNVYQRSARIGRNPRTGDAVPIPSRRVLRFRPTLDLEEK